MKHHVGAFSNNRESKPASPIADSDSNLSEDAVAIESLPTSFQWVQGRPDSRPSSAVGGRKEGRISALFKPIKETRPVSARAERLGISSHLEDDFFEMFEAKRTILKN